MTTVATVHEARCTEAIHAALAGEGLVPAEHLVDAAYVDAELLVAQPRGARDRPARPAAAEPGLAGQGRGRVHPRPLRDRLGARAGALPAGQVVERLGPAGRPEGRRGLRLGLVPRGGLRRLPGADPVHPDRAGPAAQAAAAGRARGADGGAAAARDQGGPARLRAAGRDRGHDLARGARLRPAPQPLPRAGQDAPAARGDRGRDRPPAPRRLVPGGPARRHPHLPLRRPRDGLSRLRQRYPPGYRWRSRPAERKPGRSRLDRPMPEGVGCRLSGASRRLRQRYPPYMGLSLSSGCGLT